MIVTDDQLDMATASVADVALAFPQALEVFNRYNLDYCCGGKKPFVKACEKAGLIPEQVWHEIHQFKSNYGADSRMRFDTWDAPLLIDFIVQHHHQYVKESIPTIQALLDKVCRAHGDDNPFVLAVSDDFNDLADELLQHMPKEEEVLFPAMRQLYTYSTLGSPASQSSLNAPIEVMEHEHESAGQLIKSIRSLTGNYTPPEYACPTFRMTYLMLRQFDRDLMQHIHLENNILFPMVTNRRSAL